MGTLSINEAWNETAAFVKREAGLLFPIAFLLVALPGSVVRLFAPQAAPGQLPEPGLWLLFMALSGIVAMIGTIAISYLALRPGASVGEALGVGARRFIFLLGATLLVALAAMIVAVPVVVIAGAIAFSTGASTAGSSGIAVLLLIVVGLGVIALWVRLMLMTPVAAVETGGPIAIIRRSWDLTRGYFWRLLGFVLLVVVAALVVTAVISALAGIVIVLIAGRPDPLTLAAILLGLVGALVQALFSMVFATLIARIYAHLAGPRSPNVFA